MRPWERTRSKLALVTLLGQRDVVIPRAGDAARDMIVYKEDLKDKPSTCLAEVSRVSRWSRSAMELKSIKSRQEMSGVTRAAEPGVCASDEANGWHCGYTVDAVKESMCEQLMERQGFELDWV